MDSRNANASDCPPRRTALVASEIGRYDIDIAALSETRLPNEDSLTEVGGGYTFFWRGLPEEADRIHGVGFAIKTSLLNSLSESPIGISERLMTLRIPLTRSRYVTLISAYAPTLTSDENIKDAFYDLLERTLRNIPHTDKILLLGDFNARVGSNNLVWGGIIGMHGVGHENANGLRLLNLCAEHILVITNTFFQMPDKYKTTWMHPRSKHLHLIDYVITRQRDLRDIIITRALRGAECWTDHRLLRSLVKLNIRPPVRRQAGRKQINRAPFHNKTRLAELHSALSDAVNDLETQNIVAQPSPEYFRSKWDAISTSLFSTTESVFGNSQRRHQDWFDSNNNEIQDLLQRKNQAHDATLNNPLSISARQNFNELRSEAQAILRQMENNWWQNKAIETQAYFDNNDFRNLFDSIKSVYGPVRNTYVPLRSADGATLIKDQQGILQRWVEHLSDLLNRVNPADPHIFDTLPTLPPVHHLDQVPSFEEVLKAKNSLKNNKAAGPDGLPGEIFKYGGYAVTRCLYKLILEIWDAEILPQQWIDPNIVTIYKRKGDKSDCSNYRGISLLSVAGKILARILLSRLLDSVADVVLPESQCGFRRDRSTIDMIFVARLLQEKCREQHKDLYLAFIDLTKAFDTVNREILWNVLSKCGCPPKFMAILRGFHNDMSARVVAAGLISDPFEVNVGVKQGCVLAPALFNIYLAAVTLLARYDMSFEDGIHFKYRFDGGMFNLRRLKAETKTRTATIFELQYADDAAIPTNSAEALQRNLTIMSDTYRKAGLSVNTRKTEVLYQPANPGDPADEFHFHINNSELPNVDNFMYLGSILNTSCNLDQEIQYRIRQATTYFGRLHDRVFLNRNLSVETKVMVYSSVCLSILLYGCEAWTIYRAHIRSLESFHIRSLQKILGLTWADCVPHVTILQTAKSSSIESLIIRRQLRWVGHVIRMPENRLPKQLLFGELSEGHRSVGGQKKRFKDHLNALLKKCNIPSAELEERASDRIGWRSSCRQAAQQFEADRTQAREEARQRRHERELRGPADGGVQCPTCGRLCASEFGLRSHRRFCH